MNKLTVGIVAAVVVVGAITLIATSNNKSNMSDTMPTKSTATTTSTESNQVQSGKVALDIKDFDFSNHKLRVKAGTTVTWTNRDSAHHDINPDQESPDFVGSGKLLAKGDSYSYTFQKAGTFAYHCTPHPYMKASIEVVQ